MSKLAIILTSGILIALLFIVERIWVWQLRLKNIKKLQLNLIKNEQHILNRLSLLILSSQGATGLQDEVFQSIRYNLYNSPSSVRFNSFIDLCAQILKEEDLNTLEFGLNEEITGNLGLLKQDWQDYHSHIKIWEKMSFGPLTPFFRLITRKTSLNIAKFQV